MKQNPHVQINYFKGLKLLQKHANGSELRATSKGSDVQAETCESEEAAPINPMKNFKFQQLSDEDILASTDDSSQIAALLDHPEANSANTTTAVLSSTSGRKKKGSSRKAQASQDDRLWTGPLSGNYPNLLWRAVVF